MSGAYYNELDPEKAQWIRELIKAGVVAPGDVDERSICDVRPDDLRGYTQCHFFAGIAVWSYALRLAGWPDSRPVWTGSCPCPSFSCAGKGEGFSDPRHLWPDWFRLIRECRPSVVFGEQVEAAIGHGWLDLVQDQLESAHYAVGKAVLTAAGAGAPHIRQRLYFCADTELSHHACQCTYPDGRQSENGNLQRSGEQRLLATDCGAGDGAHTERNGGGPDLTLGQAQGRTADGRDRATGDGSDSAQRGWGEGGTNLSGSDERTGAQGQLGRPALSGGSGDRDDSDLRGSQVRRPEGDGEMGELSQKRGFSSNLGATFTESGSGSLDRDHALGAGLEGHLGDVREWRGPGWLDPESCRRISESGATGGFWRDCDWWYGRDGKYRPIGPGLFPLAHGAAARVLRLRGYGDAICAEVAKAFIAAYREARGM